MPTDVRLIGADDAMRDIARWADQLGPEVERSGRGFAGDVADRVSTRVPVLTGALAASVSVVELTGEDGVGVSMGDGLDYAAWIEFGGARGRPYIPEGRYLYPTAEASESEWVALAADVADDTVRSYPWSKG